MSVVTSAGVPMVTIGIIVTIWPLTAAEMPPMVAVTTPLSSVVKALRYFEDNPSQPQLLAPGAAAAGLIHLGDGSAASAERQQHLGQLGAGGVVLVSGERDRGEYADDRDDDHQFDQREARCGVSHACP